MKREILHLRIRQKSYLLGERTWYMGVLNVTPDSFSDGGQFLAPEKAIERALQMIDEGADIIDIGGESSRPGSDPVPAEEELRRIMPVIKGLRRQTNCLLSVDTTKSLVAQQALDEGADIINDISAGQFDPRMLALARKYHVPVILMHMKGRPKTMQINPFYKDTLQEIGQFLAARVETASQAGLTSSQIIIDPGIGFGKRFEDNLLLLNHLHYFQKFHLPLLVGVSRKSFIGEIIAQPPEKRLAGTIGACLVAVLRGTHILRVHDVRPIREAVQVAEKILATSLSSSSSENKEVKERYVH
jgi:dihydropteroate synthase